MGNIPIYQWLHLAMYIHYIGYVGALENEDVRNQGVFLLSCCSWHRISPHVFYHVSNKCTHYFSPFNSLLDHTNQTIIFAIPFIVVLLTIPAKYNEIVIFAI